MNKIKFILLTLSLALGFVPGQVFSANALNHDEAVKLLEGNTAEGVNTKWDKKMIWYFQKGGVLRKQKPNGKRGRADWHIDKKGQLCYQDKQMDEEACEPILPREDGGYDTMDGRWRIDKVIPGNAHSL